MRSAPRKKRESGALREVWQAHNEIIDFVREIAPMPSVNSNVIVTRTSNGTLFRANAANRKGIAGEVVRMRLISVSDDYLNCRNISDGETVKVAKPFNLRRSGWDGATINYTLETYPGGSTPFRNSVIRITYQYVSVTYRKALVGTSIEHQVVRPFYINNFSEIFAASCENSGVPGADDWIDVNADARAWSMVL